MAIGNWLRGVRQVVTGEYMLDEQPMREGGPTYIGGAWYGDLGLDTTRTNYEKARALYANTLRQYKLGAHFAKPVVNTNAGFTGVPDFRHPSDQVTQALADQFRVWGAQCLLANRNTFRDGDCYARLDYQASRFELEDKQFRIRLLPPQWCEPEVNPLTGYLQQFTVRYPVQIKDADGRKSTYTLVEVLTPSTRSVQFAESDRSRLPADVLAQYEVEGEPNAWGFIPVVWFRNEHEDNALFGTSDLEALEPLFKAYHETMLVGHQGIQLFARPKAKLKVRDVNAFMAANFPGWRPGQQVNFKGRDLLVFKASAGPTDANEDADYMTAPSGTEGVQILLELTFYCIVQSSQVPEFVLGTAVASSKASVDTQMLPFQKAIERKRGMVGEPYLELAHMYLAMANKVGDLSVPKGKLELVWPEMTPKDETALATVITQLTNAFSVAVEAKLISPQSAVDFLGTYVDTMVPYASASMGTTEQARIEAGVEWVASLAPKPPPEAEAEDIEGRPLAFGRNGANGAVTGR